MRVARFAMVGLAKTGLDYGTYWLLLGIGLAPHAGNLVSVLLAASSSFLANRHFTFADNRHLTPLGRQLGRHAAATTSALVISAAVIHLLAPFAGPLAAKALAVPLVFAWNYRLASRWVWGRAA